MPRQNKEVIAIQPAQGKRKTFDESDGSGGEHDLPEAGPSRRQSRDEAEEVDDSNEDDNDDEAPEAVTVVSTKRGTRTEEDDVAR